MSTSSCGSTALAGCLALTLGMPGLAQAHGDPTAKSNTFTKGEQQDWGIAAPVQAATRTVEFTMSDRMRITPDTLSVRLGETLRIVIRNEGAMRHEFVPGTKPALEAHAALMMRFPNMAHDEPYMAHVEPQRSGEIVWTFNRAGAFDFACLIPGHYQAGMVGTIAVAAP